MANFRKTILLLIGSLLIATSATLVGYFAPKGHLMMVFIGYIIFVVGYKVSWFSEHGSESFQNLMSTVRAKFLEGSGLQNLFHNLITVLGVMISSYGTTMLAQTILGTRNYHPALSGAIIFGGYMISHEGVNRVLI